MSIESQLERALADAAPPVDETGVWEQMQPRIRRAHRRHRIAVGFTAGSAVVVAAITLIGALRIPGAVRDRDPASEPAVPVTTTEAPPEKAEEPESPSINDALDVASNWVAALAAGDVDGAWELLSDHSRQSIGRDGFDAVVTELEEGFGSWANAGPTLRGVPIDVATTPTVVVILSGTRTVEGMVEESTSAIPTVHENGEWRVEWYGSVGGEFVPSMRSGSTLGFEPLSPTSAIEWVGAADGRNGVIVDGDARFDVEQTLEGEGLAHVMWAPAHPLAEGTHTLVLVVVRESGAVTVLAVPVVVEGEGS